MSPLEPIFSSAEDEEERLRRENLELRAELSRTSELIGALERKQKELAVHVYFVVAEHLRGGKLMRRALDCQDAKIRELEARCCGREERRSWENSGRMRGMECRHAVYERLMQVRAARKSAQIWKKTSAQGT